MASAIPFITSGIGGLLGGIGRSRPQTSTSSTQSKSNQTANLDAKQRKVNKALFKQILDAIKLGPQVKQADRNIARGQINDTFDATSSNLESNMAARGFGSSGKLGSGFRDLLIDRAKGFQSAEGDLRNEAQNRFMQMIQSAFQFNTPRSFTNESSSTTTGTQPGQNWMSSLGGGLGDLSSMLFLRGMMNGGGGGFPAGFGNQVGSASGMWPCHVAIELYGETDWRTLTARAYLREKACKSIMWMLVVIIYSLVGKAIASLIHKSKTLRHIFKPLFDQILVKVLNSR